MAAYAALLSVSQTTHPNRTQHKSLFSSHAEKKIRSIYEYVIPLLEFFEKCPEKSNRWEVRIRDAAYKIEDIIETFMWQQIQDRASRVALEDQLESVKVEIGQIAGEVMEERPAYLPASSSSSRLATAANDAVIGLHDDIMAIKERLCGQYSPNLQVIPIVGMGGIGKTTLARTVYEDPLIIEHFDICAWAVVSQDYSPHRFLKNLLDSMKLLEEQMFRDEIDESEIGLKVYQSLKGRRYLVIIDDVWEQHVWDDVKAMFPDDNNGSRIMLTTRLADVGDYANCGGHVHAMKFMDESRSWDLLRQKVFGDGCCPPELEEVGKGIAGRCGGLPLAVVLVAGVLSAASASQASWEEIAENVYRVVGRDLEAILSLSYTYLPHHLRSCFLFIGGFQKDVNIRTSRLIRLWAAEGFQRTEEICEKSLEEKAEEYLEDLVKRNLVVVTSREIDGKIKSCSLHDIVQDLCITKAHQEKFLRVMDLPQPQVLMNERRISFSCSKVGTVLCPTLRTILCSQMQKVPSWLALLGEYKLLRVLDALGVDLTELPSKVFELYHLRYLALMGSFSIPPAVSNLVNLQTLTIHLEFGNLRGRYAGVVPHSLPLEIWKLQQLRHLFFHAPYMLPHPPQGLNLPLQYLQTLLLVADFVWDENILQLIPNIKRLGLTYISNQEHHFHHLKDLHLLEKLEVIGYPGFSWRVQNPSFPSKLKKLTLVGGGFPWKDMAIVGSLPNLQVLKLLDNACDGETWETADEEFPQLKLLLIDESHLQHWITESNPFPTLKRLVLRSCGLLREIPEGIGEIPTLELIEVDYCTKSLLKSAKKIKEEQEDYGNDLQVRVGHEVIQSFDERMDLLSEVEERPAVVLSPSRLAPTVNGPLLGLDDDLVKIKERLCGQSPKLQVVPIVGKGGIGKTSLAITVYEDPSILQYFDIRVWLTVSLDYSSHRLRKILLGLLDSMKLIEEQMPRDKVDDSDLASRVYLKLKGRRYLVVIDDIRDIEVWGNVRNIFPDEYNGSRVIVTSRLLYIAAFSDSYSPLHHMRMMSDSQCWDLLKQKVFGDNNCPPSLEGIGEEIARRCAGLPIAVVLVAGLLSTVNNSRASWEEIAEDLNAVVDRVSDRASWEEIAKDLNTERHL